jgi:hypothetical protein
MKREFNVGDIARLSKGKRFKGILNNETYKTFSKKWKDEVKIIKFRRADSSIGGYSYDCEVEHNGEIYVVECLGQFDLIPKKMWEESCRLKTELERLTNNK